MHSVWAKLGRSTVVFAVGVFVAAGTVAAAVGAVWVRAPEYPRVTVLGAGEGLSVLITAGEARLLIATGDDTTAFGNALGRARGPIQRRLDVLLVAGDGAHANVPATAVEDLGARSVAALGPVRSGTGALGGVEVLPSPRRIELSREVAVTVGWEEVTEEGGPDVVWWAVVRRGATVVAIVSDERAAALSEASGQVGALVVARGEPFEALAAVPAEVVMTTGAGVTGAALRASAAQAAGRALWGVRVFPGEAVRLDLVEDGIEVEREGVQRLEPPTTVPVPTVMGEAEV